YIVQRVKRIKEERSGEIGDDRKFTWTAWGNLAVVQYYEAWKMHQGRVFPRLDAKTAGQEHFDVDQPAPFAYDEKVLAMSPVVRGVTYYNDTFSTTLGAALKKSPGKMIREAILAWVYFIPITKTTSYEMSWYEEFKNVAKHWNKL